MARVLELINGVPRGREEAAGSTPAIYDETLTVVSGVAGAGEISGPVTTGTLITLPNSKTYDSQELNVILNGQYLDDVLDYNFEGIAPRTQVSMTFDLVVGDKIRFRIDRNI